MATITLWKDKKNRMVDPTLFSTIAEEMARAIGKEDSRKNKGTQLRRFFDELVRINTRAQREGDDWHLTHPLVHMMVAKVAYARGRNLVTESFVNLIRDGIAQVHDREDLQVLTNFLEAFMGFYKVHGPK
ncbi:type III-A CRISPR-associated protein Csm2 [Desulfolithobacter sp.]